MGRREEMREGKRLTIWQQHDSHPTSQHSLQSSYSLPVPRGEYPFLSVQLLPHQLAKSDRCRGSELRVRFLRRLLWIVSLWARGAGRMQGGGTGFQHSRGTGCWHRTISMATWSLYSQTCTFHEKISSQNHC
jgi:hypothetical protein